MRLAIAVLLLQILSLPLAASETRIYRDYSTAYRDAQAQQKFLLIRFHNNQAQFERRPKWIRVSS
jgi:hypothetical protein